MPFQSSFASAAAGLTHSERPSPAKDIGSSDWPRNRSNGSTATFRRPPGARAVTPERERANSGVQSGPVQSRAYIPPHQLSSPQQDRQSSSADRRYSKEELLEIFKDMQKGPKLDVQDFLIHGHFQKRLGGQRTANWGKPAEDQKDNRSELCWNSEGNTDPLSLTAMSQEEQALFNESVNSSLKHSTKDPVSGASGRSRPNFGADSSGRDNDPRSPGNRFRAGAVESALTVNDSHGNDHFSRTTGEATAGEKMGRWSRQTLLRPQEERSKPPSALRDMRDTHATGDQTHLGRVAHASDHDDLQSITSKFGSMGSFDALEMRGSGPESKTGSLISRGQSRFKSMMSEIKAEDSGDHDGLIARQERHGVSSANLPRLPNVGNDGGLSTSPSHEERHVSHDIDRQPASSQRTKGGMSSILADNSPWENHRPLPDDTEHSDVRRLRPGDKLNDVEAFTSYHPLREREAPSHDLSAHFNLQSQSRGNSPDIHHTHDLGRKDGLSSIWGNSSGDLRPNPRSFLDSPFAGFGDLNMPGSGGLSSGHSNRFGSATSLAAAGGRPSKLGSLFSSGVLQDQPQPRSDPSIHNLQLQDRVVRNESALDRSALGSRSQTNSPGVSQMGLELHIIDRNGDQIREFARPVDMIPNPGTSETSATKNGTEQHAHQGKSIESDHASSNPLPASQQRQMVMPDRIRWTYRDPHGNQQGPWSGLEMHDWYMAGFFSPELQVKKQEDVEYEPLAQLIRRIGNSREPFLVPQIGIPHGVAHGASGATSSNPVAPSSSALSIPGTAQPPFASSFPSFGTTLTAEQQNALERRKQEEQYLIARQKEHLAAMQPNFQRHMQQQHLQSSLQSQPPSHSGSSQNLQGLAGNLSGQALYSNNGHPAKPQQASLTQGYNFDISSRNAANSALGAHDTYPALKSLDGGFLEGMPADHGSAGSGTMSMNQYEQLKHEHRVNLMLQERSRLQQEGEDASHDQGNHTAGVSMQRIQEFQDLRASENHEESIRQSQQHDSHALSQSHHAQAEQSSHIIDATKKRHPNDSSHEQDVSLSQQIRQAAAKQDVQPQETRSAWSKQEEGMPQPLPPPSQSSSPMPAPTPRRNRQSVADALNAESQDRDTLQAEHVEAPTPTVAPWAKETTDNANKGPSLKEIQAMEAHQAALQEETIATARRAVLEQERLALQAQAQTAVAPAPGLPSTANWANSTSASPAPLPTSSPWTKKGSPAAKTSVVVPAVNSHKKTLAQIQKEEEMRKQRTAAAAATSLASQSGLTGPGGKRYADLASKPSTNPGVVSASTVSPSNAAWTTVGASGKTKAGPVHPVQTQRSTSGLGSSNNTATISRATMSTNTPAKTAAHAQAQSAEAEFTRWIKQALAKGLTSGISVDDFTSTLMSLPSDTDIISEAIYASSQTLDGRRFADEFVRRRRLAERGIVPPISDGGFTGSKHSDSSKAGSNSSGGWSEVAKKGSNTDQSGAGAHNASNGQFRVVAGKKRGGKR